MGYLPRRCGCGAGGGVRERGNYDEEILADPAGGRHLRGGVAVAASAGKERENGKRMKLLIVAAAVAVWLWLGWRVVDGHSVKTALKKLAALIAVLGCGGLAWLSHEGAFHGTVPGTEQTVCGTVTDRAMDVIDRNTPFSPSRGYLGIAFPDGGGTCVWLQAFGSTEAKVGDTVRIRAAREEKFGIPVAVEITVLEDA